MARRFTCRAPLPEAFSFAEACEFVDEGRESEAMEKLRETLQLCAKAPWAAPHYNLGILLSRKMDFVRAEHEFRIASELRPDDPDAALNWGKALLCIGRRGEAAAALQRAKRLQPPGATGEADKLLATIAPKTSEMPPSRRGLGALSAAQISLLRQRRGLPAVAAGSLGPITGTAAQGPSAGRHDFGGAVRRPTYTLPSPRAMPPLRSAVR
eukprot:gnl/TRDRNA2_/TRDRNA2_146621_c0_seq2.p2 gnl/TRDRNA2_/TRDRNA2_146621_c0~~gnl/TRDRNA2_/TRDRNA2_146621_c0_seq2.p2  ORF type:complete len:211 (-),score=36.64 gnl/TRDRNA2_/TRDRNA2_146621_c0_seq2:3-635(-)